MENMENMEGNIDALFKDIPLNTFMHPFFAQRLMQVKLKFGQGTADYFFQGTGSDVVEFVRGEDFFDPDRLNSRRVYVLRGNTHPVAFYETPLGIGFDLVMNLDW